MTEETAPSEEIVPTAPKRSITLPRTEFIAAVVVMVVVALIFAASNPKPNGHFDYQYRIARALLEGQLGLPASISWLNELVPFEGKYYSVFPLGSILSMLPVALLQKLRGVEEFPAREVTAWCAGMTAFFLLMLSERYGDNWPRRLLLVSWGIFASWYWANAVYAGAWHLALGMAFLGLAGTLAFTLVNRQPLLAGLCFAVAFGNRTEILFTAPLILYLLVRHDPWRDDGPAQPIFTQLRTHWREGVFFCIFPFLLGVGTLWYNYARFHSPLNFGYDLIPGMLKNEYWYKYGFTSWRCIHYNLQTMLFSSSWSMLIDPPFFRPEPFGGSIISASPFLFLVLRDRYRDRALRFVAWLGITITFLAIALHGNNGGIQFSYRYGMTLIPWFFLLLLDHPEGRLSPLEIGLFILSLLSNAWAVYMFYWSGAV